MSIVLTFRDKIGISGRTVQIVFLNIFLYVFASSVRHIRVNYII